MDGFIQITDTPIYYNGNQFPFIVKRLHFWMNLYPFVELAELDNWQRHVLGPHAKEVANYLKALDKMLAI